MREGMRECRYRESKENDESGKGQILNYVKDMDATVNKRRTEERGITGNGGKEVNRHANNHPLTTTLTTLLTQLYLPNSLSSSKGAKSLPGEEVGSTPPL